MTDLQQEEHISVELTPFEEQRAELAEMTAEAQRAWNDIDEEIRQLYAMADDDEEVQHSLVTVHSKANQIADYVARQDAALTGVLKMAEKLREQRNRAAEELDKIEQALDDHYHNEHPKVDSLIEEVENDHLDAFWSSLPYDMMDVLGEGWHHWDADNLYTAITVDIDKVDEDGDFYGYTPDQLRQFRADLLVLVRRLHGDE